MKNTIARIAAVTIAGAGLTVASAATAHADLNNEVGFLQFLTDKGLYVEGENQAGKMLAGGYWVCHSRATNSGLDLVEYVYRNTGASVALQDAIAIVAASEAFLCPEYLNTPVDVPGNAPAPAPSALV